MTIVKPEREQHMQFIFSKEAYKGNKYYLDTQKKYEVFRTCIYFGICLVILAIGWIYTGNKLNLLTVIAVNGCLPASKSAVQMIMHERIIYYF